jgi:Neuraminidase (sialidase)
MMTRRTLLLGVAAVVPRERRNVIVFQEAGRYGGWPANHGLWAWGKEAVVGFTSAWYKPAKNDHAVDRAKKFEDWQARTLDAGETWSVEKPPVTTNGDNFIPKTEPLKEPIDFTAPGLAMMFGMPNLNGGSSWLYVSTDRCRTWSRPYTFTVKGIDRLAARTNYLIFGKRECIMFGSAAKANQKEGRVFCARTTDGGLSWKLLSLIGPEPAGYMIMPSTVRLTDSRLLTSIRHKDPDTQGSIDFYLSEDQGRTWKPFGAIEKIGGGNPPALVKMSDGRLALTYGYRAKPWGIRARVSEDQGRTWGEELILRDDGLTGDLGYPVSMQRPDGRMFSAYYFNGPRDEDRTIQGTIWKA